MSSVARRPEFAYVGDCCVGTINRSDSDVCCVCGVRWSRVPGLGWTAAIDWDDYDFDPTPHAQLSNHRNKKKACPTCGSEMIIYGMVSADGTESFDACPDCGPPKRTR